MIRTCSTVATPTDRGEPDEWCAAGHNSQSWTGRSQDHQDQTRKLMRLVEVALVTPASIAAAW